MGKTKTFLVVEDDKQIRSFISFSLKAQEYQCTEVSKGKDAMRVIAMEDPDIMILDLGLPDMDGLDIIKRIYSIDGLSPTLSTMMGAKTT